MLDAVTVLDVGAGTGRGVRYLESAGFQACGVEPVSELVREGARHYTSPAMSFVRAQGELLPFADGSFDAVSEFGMLHHVPEPNVVVKEMLRVARKAVFLSDSNRFGQGPMVARRAKLLLHKARLWGLANFVKTAGKQYVATERDGLIYSYSVFDSIPLVADWADRIVLVPTRQDESIGQKWRPPLISANHLLLCGLRDAI